MRILNLSLALLAVLAVVAIAAPTPVQAQCEDCYECLFDEPPFATRIASCCSGLSCQIYEQDSDCSKERSSISDCYLFRGLDNTNYCRGYQTCTGGGGGPGGGGPGGGGPGGGDGCVYGPTSFCPVSCSSCTWDPFF
ncbi:MAG: hypothetical protein AAGN66_17380 [Acidobacteriota bacterium]